MREGSIPLPPRTQTQKIVLHVKEAISQAAESFNNINNYFSNFHNFNLHYKSDNCLINVKGE